MAKGIVDASEFAEWWLVEDGVDAVTAFITTAFPGAQLVERHGQHVRFKLPPIENTPLSRIFKLFEDNKGSLRIAEYSLSQTSLEQIFNMFASHQEEETGAVRGFA